MTRRAIVIGAGFGGLALAIRLQSAGVETTVVEARDRPGGRAYHWRRDGFIFDAGPTVITDPPCLQELWALSGQDSLLSIVQMPAGIPVGTLAIGEAGATNAALLAAAVLALNDPELAERLEDYRREQTATVAEFPVDEPQ